MFNPKLIKIIQIFVSIFALIMLFQFIDVVKAFEVFQSINYLFVPIIFLLIIANILLYVFNVFISLTEISLIKEERFVYIFVDYLKVWAFGLFLPGKIGELGIIPLLKHKYGVPYGSGTIAVILPKVMMIIILVVAVFLFGSAYILLTVDFSMLILTLLFCILLIILFIVLIKHDFFNRFKVIKSIIVNKENLKFFFKPKQLTFLIMVAILRFLTVVFSFYFAFVALGFFVEFNAILLAVALSQVIAFIPISTNGLGVREASFAGVMLFFGIATTISLGVVIINLVVSYGFAMILIVYSMFK